MKQCPICNRKYYSDRKKFCTEDNALLEFVKETEQLTLSPLEILMTQESLKDKDVSEFRRQCKECRTIWHSLVEREKRITKELKMNFCIQIMMCANPRAMASGKRNTDRSINELARLRICPKCNSKNYDENIIS